MKRKISGEIIPTIKMAHLLEGDIHDDVLERFEGCHSFSGIDDDECSTIYEVSVIEFLATKSKDNDTNETTRIRINKLYKQIRSCKYLMITK